MASRSPIQLGAELYGEAGLSGDIEVITLMLETLQAAGLSNMTLDLGHVGIYRSLLARASLSSEQEQALFDALQRKAPGEVETLIASLISDKNLADMMLTLSQLNGDSSVLATARQRLAASGDEVLAAIDALEQVAASINARMPNVQLYFDLCELRGYRYHTGLVFAALAPGHGYAIANGGRYDDVGAAFGRARPATGFNTDLKALLAILPASMAAKASAILAPCSSDSGQWQAIQALRAKGERVISALNDSTVVTGCDRQLVLEQGQWVVKPL
jgi:ATP phosphoribosyltransferase regulatory subunit